MKKLTLILGAVAMIAMTSCKKDYTCDCTYDDGAGSTMTATVDINDAKKSDAEDACDALEGNGINGSCELK